MEGSGVKKGWFCLVLFCEVPGFAFWVFVGFKKVGFPRFSLGFPKVWLVLCLFVFFNGLVLLGFLKGVTLVILSICLLVGWGVVFSGAF